MLNDSTAPRARATQFTRPGTGLLPVSQADHAAEIPQPSSRLADPRIPLSVDEDRDFRIVRAAVYFLRTARKNVSRRAIEAQLKTAGVGIRHDVVCAHLRRLATLETLKNQYGDHHGTTRGPKYNHKKTVLLPLLQDKTYSSTDYGTTRGPDEDQNDAPLPLTVKYKNVVKGSDEKTTPVEKTTDGEKAIAPSLRHTNGTTLREPTDGEVRVLAVCYQWQRGVSVPMLTDLVELYRTMRPLHDLPRRPGA